jgi:hypothetical protein
MKKMIQRILVGLSLIVIIPGALFALLLLAGAIGSGFRNGFEGTDIIAMPLLVLPAIMGWWGVKLVSRLKGIFSQRIRRETMIYHGANLCYCGMWLASTANRDGNSYPIFNLEERIMGLGILALPLIAALVSPNDDTKEPEAE